MCSNSNIRRDVAALPTWTESQSELKRKPTEGLKKLFGRVFIVLVLLTSGASLQVRNCDALLRQVSGAQAALGGGQ